MVENIHERKKFTARDWLVFWFVGMPTLWLICTSGGVLLLYLSSEVFQ